MVVVKKAGLLSADEDYKLISPVIIELFDETMNDPRTDADVGVAFGFTPFSANTKNGQIQTKLGVSGSPLVAEFGDFTMDDEAYGPKISYDVVRTFPGEGMSSEAKKWSERADKATDISEPLRQDLANSINRISRKLLSIKITENEYKTKIFTEGFAITNPYGYGSAVIDGKPLYSRTHVNVGTGATYSNIVDEGLAETGTATTKHAPLTFKSLKLGVKMLREMKDGNGVRMRRPKSGIYDLFVSVEGEENALNILSDLTTFAPYTYTGADAGNDNYSNIWTTRDGFKVRLNVIETFNQPDSQDSSKTVGNATNWFLINKEEAMKRGAFRDIEFGDVAVEIFYEASKKASFITAEKFFGAQALYAEVTVGSLGNASTIA